jgi:DNA-binding transcriptional regulator PaaX
MKKAKSKKITEEIFRKLGDIFDVFFIEPGKRPGPPPLVGSQIELLQDLLRSDWAERQITNVFYYFKKKGYLVRRKISGQDKYFLSNKGIEKILRLRAQEKVLRGPKKFKDKYLIIIFDIPVQERRKRAILRSVLRRLKFEKLQQSVWITKFNILKEVKTLVKFYKLGSYVRFMFVREAEKEI